MNVLERFFEAIVGEEKRPKGIHVTSLVHDCLRRSYYQQKFGSFFSLKTMITFWIGKQLHRTKILNKNEFKLEWEGVVGSIDDFEDGVLIEKKTCTTTYRNPLDHHKRQVEYYSVLLRKNGFKFKEGRLIYINLVDKEVVEFPVSVRGLSTIADEMLEKKKVLEGALKSKKPPARSMSWLCNYCSFANICFGVDRGVK